jgi:2-polyprenyl-3-methyl-5-hydroxy-6-metoxy-1,4-benzoquinol methylase
VGASAPGHAPQPGRGPAAARPALSLTDRAAIVARILSFGERGLEARPECANIASLVGVAQYVAMATEIAGVLRSEGRQRVLDWGAGWGQTSLLLQREGLEVVAYDIEDKGAATGLLAGTDVRYVVTAPPALPFADDEFDAVLNSGVLEHVADPPRALGELYRVLRPGGWLFTYHLPNRHAGAEWLGRRLGRFHHERTYTRAEAEALFRQAGFEVSGSRPFHWLPRNVWGRSARLRAVAGASVRAYEAIDGVLVRLPGLRRLATAWALRARRPVAARAGRAGG